MGREQLVAMNETNPANASAGPATAKNVLYPVRRLVRLEVRLALAALYGLVLIPQMYDNVAIPILCGLAYFLIAPLACFQSRTWWRLEPGWESLYWHVLGCAEFLLVVFCFVVALLIPTT